MAGTASAVPAFADDFSDDAPAISRDKRVLDWKARVVPLEPPEGTPSWVKEAVRTPLDEFSKVDVLVLKLLSSSLWDFAYVLLLFVWVILVGEALDTGVPIVPSAATVIPALMVLAILMPSIGGVWFALARPKLVLIFSTKNVTQWAIGFVVMARAVCFARERGVLRAIEAWVSIHAPCLQTGCVCCQRRQTTGSASMPANTPAQPTVPRLTLAQEMLEHSDPDGDVEQGSVEQANNTSRTGSEHDARSVHESTQRSRQSEHDSFRSSLAAENALSSTGRGQTPRSGRSDQSRDSKKSSNSNPEEHEAPQTSRSREQLSEPSEKIAESARSDRSKSSKNSNRSHSRSENSSPAGHDIGSEDVQQPPPIEIPIEEPVCAQTTSARSSDQVDPGVEATTITKEEKEQPASSRSQDQQASTRRSTSRDSQQLQHEEAEEEIAVTEPTVTSGRTTVRFDLPAEEPASQKLSGRTNGSAEASQESGTARNTTPRAQMPTTGRSDTSDGPSTGRGSRSSAWDSRSRTTVSTPTGYYFSGARSARVQASNGIMYETKGRRVFWNCSVCGRANDESTRKATRYTMGMVERGQYLKASVAVLQKQYDGPICSVCGTPYDYKPRSSTSHMFSSHPKRFQAFSNYPRQVNTRRIRPPETRWEKLRERFAAARRPSQANLLLYDWRLPIYLGVVMPSIPRKDPKFFPFRVGQPVECKRGCTDWERAIITHIHAYRTYDIRYDSGHNFTHVEEAEIRYPPMTHWIGVWAEACFNFLLFLFPISLLQTLTNVGVLFVAPLLFSCLMICAHTFHIVQLARQHKRIRYRTQVAVYASLTHSYWLMFVTCIFALDSPATSPALYGTGVFLLLLATSLSIMYTLRLQKRIWLALFTLVALLVLISVFLLLISAAGAGVGSYLQMLVPLMLATAILGAIRYFLEHIWDVTVFF